MFKNAMLSYIKNDNLVSPVTAHYKIIESVNSEKYLGVIIDKDLTFHSHIAEKVEIDNQRVYR